MESLEGLSGGVLAFVGVMIVVQLALQITALVQLVKTPAERVSIGGRKWVWAIIILLGEIIGAILWFVVGRTAAPSADVTSASGVQVKQSAVDTLYGPKGE